MVLKKFYNGKRKEEWSTLGGSPFFYACYTLGRFLLSTSWKCYNAKLSKHEVVRATATFKLSGQC